MKPSYQNVLLELAARGAGVEPGSPEERKGIERFKDLFSDLSEENVRAKVRDVYAKDVYFNDTLKEVRGIDALEIYLLESAKAVESCRVEVNDVSVNGGNYYFRWVMDIRFKMFKRGKTTRSIGMSHIRFDPSGRIVMHQDYWDSTQGFFEHIPLIGYLIRKIKRRL